VRLFATAMTISFCYPDFRLEERSLIPTIELLWHSLKSIRLQGPNWCNQMIYTVRRCMVQYLKQSRVTNQKVLVRCTNTTCSLAAVEKTQWEVITALPTDKIVGTRQTVLVHNVQAKPRQIQETFFSKEIKCTKVGVGLV
jgi:hypothetical protein